jgi:thiamine-phosphate pyrophosphorylase
MLLYAITNRRLLADDEPARRLLLVEQAAALARGGVHYIQIREKDLPLAELRPLAAQVVQAVRSAGGATRVLVNGPAQLALDASADGVHLRSGLGPTAVRAAQQVYSRAGREAVISVACHDHSEIHQAAGASLLLFSPIFEKVRDDGITPGQGLAALRSAAGFASPVPVFALGGVTEKNADAAIRSGAAGIAAIRLFVGSAWRSLASSDASDTSDIPSNAAPGTIS